MTYKTARGTPYRIVREMWSAYGDFCGLLVEVYPGQQADSFIATLRPEDAPQGYTPTARPENPAPRPPPSSWAPLSSPRAVEAKPEVSHVHERAPPEEPDKPDNEPHRREPEPDSQNDEPHKPHKKPHRRKALGEEFLLD
jgi:hypothetical protein